MKRLYILILVIVLLWIVAWRMFDVEQPSVLPPYNAPMQPALPTQENMTGNVISGNNDLWSTGEVISTGNIDDTELPLDQNGWDLSEDDLDQVTDPEVEEIINLLEELIAENEWN
jgi:hypothetical protein